MFGVREGHTIFCEDSCNAIHHDVLIKLLLCKRSDTKTFEAFKDCIKNMVSQGWDGNSNIPDSLKHFRFPLVHWAAVYGKLAALKWLGEQGFDLAVTNTSGENAMHRLVACQAHERALDPRGGNKPNGGHGGRRYSLPNITQLFSKVANILTDARPQMLLWYDFVDRNTPLQLCLKLLMEADSQRLMLYYEALFKILCERLVELVKKEKLSAEYVRNALALRDTRGNTIWHTAAKTRHNKIIGAISFLLGNIKDIDLFCTNSNGDTPCMVALQQSFTKFATMIEEYKTPTLVIPMIKMERGLENMQCHCDPKGNLESRDDISLNYQDFDSSSTSYVESSPAIASSNQPSFSIAEEQSFTDPPRPFNVIDLQQVIFTEPEAGVNSSEQTANTLLQDANNNTSGPDSENLIKSCLENDTCLTNGASDVITSSDDPPTQKDIVIEKQVDLVISVTSSPDTSIISCSTDQQLNTTVDVTKEHNKTTDKTLEQIEPKSSDSVIEHDSDQVTQKNPAVKLNKSSPVIPESTSDQPEKVLDIDIVQNSLGGNTSKGVNLNLTPVLLINLLSEPDVSEKFQSLLKDVISGDSEKVNSAQSTLETLGISKEKLDGEITQNEQRLEDYGAKKALVNEAISKLKLKLDAVETLEKDVVSKIDKLKREREDVVFKMKKCESTCNHLKRRLSDCAGALNGLSPKQRKTS